MSESKRDPQSALNRMAVLGMANMFFGRRFPNDDAGYEAAVLALYEQHVKIQPRVPDQLRITEVVIEENPLIVFSEDMIDAGLDDSDYEVVMTAANYLFVFGEADYNDSLGGRAFQASWGAHSKIAAHIREKFGDSDPYMLGGGERMITEIAEMERVDTHRGLQLARGLIHTVAFNGTLGPEARQQFDPYAVLQRTY